MNSSLFYIAIIGALICVYVLVKEIKRSIKIAEDVGEIIDDCFKAAKGR